MIECKCDTCKYSNSPCNYCKPYSDGYSEWTPKDPKPVKFTKEERDLLQWLVKECAIELCDMSHLTDTVASLIAKVYNNKEEENG